MTPDESTAGIHEECLAMVRAGFARGEALYVPGVMMRPDPSPDRGEGGEDRNCGGPV